MDNPDGEDRTRDAGSVVTTTNVFEQGRRALMALEAGRHRPPEPDLTCGVARELRGIQIVRDALQLQSDA